MKEYVLYKKHTTVSATTTKLRAWRDVQFDKNKKAILLGDLS